MSNILIVDSGTTTADWAQVDGIHAHKMVKTPGINPYFQTANEIVELLEFELLPLINHEIVEEVFFYGAGLMSPNNLSIIEEVLYQLFSRISTNVESDILGAARSLFGKEEGIACILGTGSNSCVYDGEKITNNIRSVGFILGDEGSGAHLGTMFLQHYVRKELPKEVIDAFEDRYRYRTDEILSEIYRKPRPNKFISSFATFIEEHLSNSFVREMVLKSFQTFFDNNVCKYKNYKEVPISFTGSIAYHFREVLAEAAKTKDLEIQDVSVAPIDGLIKYHFNKE